MTQYDFVRTQMVLPLPSGLVYVASDGCVELFNPEAGELAYLTHPKRYTPAAEEGQKPLPLRWGLRDWHAEHTQPFGVTYGMVAWLDLVAWPSRAAEVWPETWPAALRGHRLVVRYNAKSVVLHPIHLWEDMNLGRRNLYWCGGHIFVDDRETLRVTRFTDNGGGPIWNVPIKPTHMPAQFIRHWCGDEHVLVAFHGRLRLDIPMYFARVRKADGQAEVVAEVPYSKGQADGFPYGLFGDALCTSHGLLAFNKDRAVLVTPTGQVECSLAADPARMDKFFDVTPDGRVVGSVKARESGSNTLLTVGDRRYNFHGRGQVRGARLTADGLGVWFWTRKQLYRIDLD